MSFIVDCFACRKSQEFDGRYEPYLLNEKFKTIKDTTWQQRKFSKNVSPWFCSMYCAMYSDKAKELEKHWNAYHRKQEDDIIYRGALYFEIGLLLFTIILYGVAHFAHIS